MFLPPLPFRYTADNGPHTQQRDRNKYNAWTVEFHPQWGSIRFRLAHSTYAPRGPSVRVVRSPDKTKENTNPNLFILPLFVGIRYNALAATNGLRQCKASLYVLPYLATRPAPVQGSACREIEGERERECKASLYV